ncbi:MAG: hypothetical protein JEZ09_10925 [Salinivirgaceae bacterium]|nr:hypothetical protein [Salinivirgaceae bacterium]
MQKFLSSMKFAFWLILSFAFWLLLGVFIALSDAYYPAIKDMGNSLIVDWLLNQSTQKPLLLIWFIGLDIIGFLLAISLLFCTKNTLLKHIKKQASLKSYTLFLIHVLFIIIMGLHVASMVFGFKYSDVSLSLNETYNFQNGYSLNLSKVNYMDDINVLKLKYSEIREHHTINKFHYKENSAYLKLYKDSNVIKEGEVHMLSPLVYGSIRVTLTNFYIPKNTESKTPSIKVVFMKNYLALYFFIFYALEILAIFFYIVLTWNKKNTDY